MAHADSPVIEQTKENCSVQPQSDWLNSSLNAPEQENDSKLANVDSPVPEQTKEINEGTAIHLLIMTFIYP